MKQDTEAKIKYRYEKIKILGLIDYQVLKPEYLDSLSGVNPRPCEKCMKPPNDYKGNDYMGRNDKIFILSDTKDLESRIDFRIRDRNVSLTTKIEKLKVETSPEIVLRPENIDWGNKTKLYWWKDKNGIVHFSWNK